MKHLKNLAIVVIALLSTFTLSAQKVIKKDSANMTKDSLNAALLDEYRKKIDKIEHLRIEDSTKKALLENQLNSLKTTDNYKKEELEAQLLELKERDIKRLNEQKAKIDSLKNNAKYYPVFGFFNDTLFNIYTRSGSFSAAARAQVISDRLQQLGSKIHSSKDTLALVELESTVDIVSGELIIMNVSENDALWNNSNRVDLANKYLDILNDALTQYKSETNIITLIKEAGMALFVILAISFLIYYIIKFFKWSEIKILSLKNVYFVGFKINNYTILDSNGQVKFLLTTNTIFKWLFILLSVYITLPILFGIFPWTKDFATILFGYILNPIQSFAMGLWDYLPNLITIIIMIIIFRYVIKGIYFIKNEIEAEHLQIPGFYPDWANPTYQIVRVLLFAFLIIMIFPYLPGSDSPVFRGVSVFLGFLFTFGSAGSLSNIIAGLVLTYMRLFKIGDRVKIGEVVGDIIEKSMLVTRVRTIKNEIISIPNSTIMNSHTVNYSSEAPSVGLIIHTTITIGYDVPWKDLHAALIDAAIKTEFILKDPKPFVLQTSLDDFYVSYQINAYTKEPNKQADIYSNLHQNIQDTCNERGIEILSPHYRAARDGSSTTIPANYLPKDYKAPSFNVTLTNNTEEKNS
jgi:small-conductance mechanosensitive channel